jgi:hypothetical protein
MSFFMRRGKDVKKKGCLFLGGKRSAMKVAACNSSRRRIDVLFAEVWLGIGTVLNRDLAAAPHSIWLPRNAGEAGKNFQVEMQQDVGSTTRPAIHFVSHRTSTTPT